MIQQWYLSLNFPTPEFYSIYQQISLQRHSGFHLPAICPAAQFPTKQPEPEPAKSPVSLLWHTNALQGTILYESSPEFYLYLMSAVYISRKTHFFISSFTLTLANKPIKCKMSQISYPHAFCYNFQSSRKGQTLNTFVVSASVTNASSPIKDLDEDVKVTLHHLTPNTVGSSVL